MQRWEMSVISGLVLVPAWDFVTRACNTPATQKCNPEVDHLKFIVAPVFGCESVLGCFQTERTAFSKPTTLLPVTTKNIRWDCFQNKSTLPSTIVCLQTITSAMEVMRQMAKDCLSKWFQQILPTCPKCWKWDKEQIIKLLDNIV